MRRAARAITPLWLNEMGYSFTDNRDANSIGRMEVAASPGAEITRISGMQPLILASDGFICGYKGIIQMPKQLQYLAYLSHANSPTRRLLLFAGRFLDGLVLLAL
jgi:hypothetical protein